MAGSIKEGELIVWLDPSCLRLKPPYDVQAALR